MSRRLTECIVPVICATLSLSAMAQAKPEEPDAPKLKDCVAERKDPALRLKCFDDFAERSAKKEEADKAKARAESTAEADKPIRWRLRNSGTITTAYDADLGKKPAQFQIGRADGKDFTAVQAAAVGVFKRINSPGSFFNTWEGFTALAWDRDTAAKSPHDARTLIGGISGPVFTSGPDDLQVLATARVGYAVDVLKDTSESFVNLHGDILLLPLLRRKQTDDNNVILPVPFVGMLARRVSSNPASPDDGRRTGFYAGIKAETQLYRFLPRLTAAASAQWFRDTRVPSGTAKRTDKFFDAALNYDLVDPKTKKGWVPSITLTRQVGMDPVGGQGPSHKTVLALSVKYDD